MLGVCALEDMGMAHLAVCHMGSLGRVLPGNWAPQLDQVELGIAVFWRLAGRHQRSVLGAVDSWYVEGVDASTPVSQALLSESSPKTFSNCWGLEFTKVSVSSWKSPKDRARDEGSESPGDALLGWDLGGLVAWDRGLWYLGGELVPPMTSTCSTQFHPHGVHKQSGQEQWV